MSVWQVRDVNILMMVTDINIDSKQCTGWPITSGKLHDDVTVSTDITKLEGKPVKVTGKVKKAGNRIRTDSFAATVKNCQDSNFRMEFRKSQVMADLQMNVNNALKVSCRSYKRTFDLGLANVDTDMAFFNLTPSNRSAVYNYRKENISLLDDVLNKHWDLNPGQISRFVTSVKISITSNLHLQGVVKTAEYPGHLHVTDNYRNAILTHLKNTL
ncbi:uncharacterized protein LOC121421238 [Lytechinus variegatus]|uniref:uncharacterized protein LOC121421238 n=1 Tax=Lytechinus variegatus TaxID=7654 RepID=UPI001BB15B90|nr:uncharacterized protein LOC121421238 [Lytechinus variegatus]